MGAGFGIMKLGGASTKLATTTAGVAGAGIPADYDFNDTAGVGGKYGR